MLALKITNLSQNFLRNKIRFFAKNIRGNFFCFRHSRNSKFLNEKGAISRHNSIGDTLYILTGWDFRKIQVRREMSSLSLAKRKFNVSFAEPPQILSSYHIFVRRPTLYKLGDFDSFDLAAQFRRRVEFERDLCHFLSAKFINV